MDFVSATTQLDAAVVSAVLDARDLYRLSLGVDRPLTPVDGETVLATRAKHPTLFPRELVHIGHVSPPLQRDFIMREASCDETVVRRVLGADRAYVAHETDVVVEKYAVGPCSRGES